MTAAVLCLEAAAAHAAHWQQLGFATAAAQGLVYVDLDSIHQEGNYRIARFLTIYATPATNINGIKMDRILQQTAFDCDHHTFTYLSTIGYFEGRKIGGSSPNDAWQEHFKTVPLDSYSQHAYRVACTSPLGTHPDLDTEQGSSPGSVKLPGPGEAGGKVRTPASP